MWSEGKILEGQTYLNHSFVGGSGSEVDGASSLVDFNRLVEERLKQRGLNEAAESWNEIWTLYCDGGPDAVESNLREQLKTLRSVISKEMKEASRVVPTKIAKSRRRR